MVSSPADRSRGILGAFEPDYEHLQEFYKDLHKHLELSLQESRTAALVAAELEADGFEVYRNIGGHGVAGMLRNQGAAKVLLRADMDALPVLEETDLPYASQVHQVDTDGVRKPVMHACGHDMHTTCLLGAAATLAAAQDSWKGTLICLFQPNEERSGGALAMVEDDLYNKVPFPDVCLAQHVAPNVRSGKIAIRSGSVMAGVESWEVYIYGRSGHASQPQSCINPIIIASRIATKLADHNSTDAIVTCGSLQAGDAYNVMPAQATMKLEVRAYDAKTLELAVQWMKSVIRIECQASRAPQRPEFMSRRTCPPTFNDHTATQRLADKFRASFSPNQVQVMEQDPGCEDFPFFLQDRSGHHASGVFWNIGSTDPVEWNRLESSASLASIAGLHSSFFAPHLDTTLRTGVEAMVVGALSFLELGGRLIILSLMPPEREC